MEKEVGNGLKKKILSSFIVFSYIFNKIMLGYRFYKLIYSSKISGRRIKIGNNVSFRQKISITGKGIVVIGDNSIFGTVTGGYFYKGICELQPRFENSKIIIGKNIASNNNLLICCADEVNIGNKTLIGEGVMMLDHNGHGIQVKERRNSIGKVAPISIGKNVWIGSRVIILSGTKIGDNSVVGAGAVVKGDFPANVIIAGNPAKVIKPINP